MEASKKRNARGFKNVLFANESSQLLTLKPVRRLRVNLPRALT